MNRASTTAGESSPAAAATLRAQLAALAAQLAALETIDTPQAPPASTAQAPRFTLLGITDPARMLPGFTFAVPVVPLCYVIGCYTIAPFARVHRIYGPVDACAAHDPARHGMSQAPPETAQAPYVATPDPMMGGAEVPTAPRPPQTPPDDGNALQEPTIGAMRANARVREYLQRQDSRPTPVEVGF